jgi:tetratricopeptide (TPR) repeat protein
LGGGQNLDLGWFDIIKQIKIHSYQPYSNNVVYDDILPIEWEWEAPPEISRIKYQINASDILGLDSNYYSNTDIQEDVGTIPSFDLSLEDFTLNGDYSIRIRAMGPDNRELTSTSINISIPKFEGLTSSENQAAKQVTYSFNNLWYSKKYTEYIDSVNDWLTSYPTSTKADDALAKIAFAYDKLGEKDKAIDVIERFIELYPENTVFKKRKNYNRDSDLVKLYADLTGADLNKLRDEFAERQAEAPREFLPAPRSSDMELPGVVVSDKVSDNSKTWVGAMLDKSAPWIIVFLMAISIMAFLQGLARKK